MKKAQSILALDLGASAFKLVLLKREAGQISVVGVQIEELPPQADSKARESALRSLLQGIPPDRFEAVVSVVDDPFACVRQVRMPRIPPAELTEAVKWELQRFLAVPPEQALVDYEILGEEEDQGNRKLKLLAAAIPVGTVKEHLAFLSQAGIKPTHLIPKAIALAAWVGGKNPDQKGPAALLEIRSTGSEFIVVQQGRPLFTRKLPVGGVEITRAMTGGLMTAQGEIGLTESEAESIKRSIGIPSGDSTELVEKGISKGQIFSLMRGSLDSLATEVERSMTFYGESSSGEGVTELVLVGGGAHLKGLSEWLEPRLGIPVRVGSMKIERKTGDSPLSLVSAVGAAVKAGSGVNFLPKELKEADKVRVQRMALTGAACAMLAGLIVLWLGMQVVRQSLRKQVDALEMEKAAVVSQLPMAQAALEVQRKTAAEPDWERLLRGLSGLTPKEIYLTELSVQDRAVTLRGRVRRVGSLEPVVTEYLRTLKEKLFSEIELRSSRRPEGTADAEEFELTGVLR